eukprot:scaffold7850_cov372-Pinguiococcus_pyrenoidosus.AAC.3
MWEVSCDPTIASTTGRWTKRRRARGAKAWKGVDDESLKTRTSGGTLRRRSSYARVRASCTDSDTLSPRQARRKAGLPIEYGKVYSGGSNTKFVKADVGELPVPADDPDAMDEDDDEEDEE